MMRCSPFICKQIHTSKIIYTFTTAQEGVNAKLSHANMAELTCIIDLHAKKKKKTDMHAQLRVNERA
jgi:hypothetical protein